jgi:hypothetical protein
MKIGDWVLIAPDVTHQEKWISGKVIETRNNPFVGEVITARTEDGNVYFDKEYNFKPLTPQTGCMP